MKTLTLRFTDGLFLACFGLLLSLVMGCSTLTHLPASDTPARVARIDAGIVEARAVAVEARAIGRDDIAVEAENKVGTLQNLRDRLERPSPAPAIVSAGQDLATGLSALWPPAAVLGSALAGLSEFLRRKKARELVYTDSLLKEVQEERKALQQHYNAAGTIVEALEDPAAAPARVAVAKLAQERGINDKVEALIKETGARQKLRPSHV